MTGLLSCSSVDGVHFSLSSRRFLCIIIVFKEDCVVFKKDRIVFKKDNVVFKEDRAVFKKDSVVFKKDLPEHASVFVEGAGMAQWLEHRTRD